MIDDNDGFQSFKILVLSDNLLNAYLQQAQKTLGYRWLDEFRQHVVDDLHFQRKDSNFTDTPHPNPRSRKSHL